MKPIVSIAVLSFLFSLTLSAQTSPNLKPSLPDLPKPPVPVDQFGNPIPALQPSAADLEAERLARQERADTLQKEDERKAAESQKRSDEQVETELRFEESQARHRKTTTIYVALAGVATLIFSRFFKRTG